MKRGRWHKSFGVLQCSVVKIVPDVSKEPGVFVISGTQSNTRLLHSEEEGSTVTIYQPTQFDIPQDLIIHIWQQFAIYPTQHDTCVRDVTTNEQDNILFTTYRVGQKMGSLRR